MIDALIVQLMLHRNTFKPDELEAVLDAMEAEPLLSPTHANVDERRRTPYDRKAFIEAVTSSRGGEAMCIWRAKAPKYSDAFIVAFDQPINFIDVDYTSGLRPSHLPQLFEAWARVADALAPEFGFVHMNWRKGTPESQAYNRGGRISSKPLRKLGLQNVHARTWFGPTLLPIIGKDRLLSLPHTRATPWGGVQLDLGESPWLDDFPTMCARQAEVRAVFDGWGLLSKYVGASEDAPAPNWRAPEWD